jgi:hypothetical protein
MASVPDTIADIIPDAIRATKIASVPDAVADIIPDAIPEAVANAVATKQFMTAMNNYD